MIHTIGGCTLHLGDAVAILPTLEKVDAIIIDPPYDLSDSSPGEKHYGMSLGKFQSKKYTDLTSGFDIDIIFPLLESLCQPFNMFCFCSNKQISKIMKYHEDRGRIVTLLVWHKVNAAPFANGVWRGDIEYIIHARDKGAVFEGNAEMKKKVSQYPIVVDPDHPTVKPLQLITKLVQISTLPGQTVLDCYAGSFTTGVACANTGRKFLGIEIDSAYFDLGAKRIEDAYRQPQLFKPAIMTQETLL